MTDMRSAGSAGLSCLCSACSPSSAMSRRQFLCTGTAGAAAAASLIDTVATSPSTARAQQPASTPGRPILIKGGCVLTLDRTLGDFESADVLIEGKTISAVRRNIAAPNAEIIDAARMIVMPGFVDTHRHMWRPRLRRRKGQEQPDLIDGTCTISVARVRPQARSRRRSRPCNPRPKCWGAS